MYLQRWKGFWWNCRDDEEKGYSRWIRLLMDPSFTWCSRPRSWSRSGRWSASQRSWSSRWTWGSGTSWEIRLTRQRLGSQSRLSWQRTSSIKLFWCKTLKANRCAVGGRSRRYSTEELLELDTHLSRVRISGSLSLWTTLLIELPTPQKKLVPH